MIRDSRQPVEAHFHVVSDFRREIYDNSLAHPIEIEGHGWNRPPGVLGKLPWRLPEAPAPLRVTNGDLSAS